MRERDKDLDFVLFFRFTIQLHKERRQVRNVDASKGIEMYSRKERKEGREERGKEGRRKKEKRLKQKLANYSCISKQT